MSDRRGAEKAVEHRSPPSNLEAEQALLGALLVNNEALHLVATFLEPEHFFLPVHGRIYAGVMHFVGRQETATPVTLKTYFENDEALEEAGGGQYLARLAGSAVTVINAGHYGRAVHDLYVRRQLIFLAEDMRDAAYDAPLDRLPADVAAGAESKLHELLAGAPGARAQQRTMGEAAHEAAREVERAYQADGALQGLPLGIRTMEESFGGLRAPDLIVLGGRPGMGKTGMALGIALAVAQAGHPVFFASLEMSAEQLGKRAPETIEDAETAGRVSDFLKQLIAHERSAESARTEEKAPYFLRGKWVDGFFKGAAVAGIAEAKKTINARLTAYQKREAEKERQRREEEERQRREEAERARREAEAKAEAARTDDDLEAAVQAEEEAKAAQAEAERAARATQVGSADLSRQHSGAGTVASLRTMWKCTGFDHQTVDLGALRHHLSRDAIEKAIRAYIRAGGRELRGATITEVSESRVA